MDKRTLVDADIDAGRELIEELAREGFDVDAAFWLYSTESDRWRLTIASRFVQRLGPRAAYQRIQAVLGTLPTNRLSLSDITVLGNRDHLVRLLTGAVARHGEDMRLARGTIDGTFIDDAFIYHLKPSRTPSRI
jgi:hypothetical protein